MNNAQDAVTGPSRPLEITEGVRNPLVDESPWFFTMTPEMPILVGEASDSAFATKIRQELLGKAQCHYPPTQTVRDETLCSLWHLGTDWPTPSRARFLLKVVFSTVCRRYYLTRKSTAIRLLEQAIREPNQCDLLSVCKLHALFALGEVYSTRTRHPDNEFPGIIYYASATRMLRLFSEQARIECIEIMLSLSIYSLVMNRRYSAYCMVGSAMRFGIIIGLHLNVPQDQLPNRETQEHRNRLWWTAYILDRNWATMLGKPVSIQDEDIEVNLPSDFELSDIAEDFADTDYLEASIRLARVGAHITASTYSRRPQETTFSDRVQQGLRDLDKWLQELPAPLRSALSQVPPNLPMPIVTLYLYFNQCFILILRPVLLYALHMRRLSAVHGAERESPTPNQTATALSEACCQHARRSFHILIDSWINGSFPTFDHTYTQYLFSASLVLAISYLANTPGSLADGDDFETAVQILGQLDSNGNFAAKEFYRHAESIKSIIRRIALEESQVGRPHWSREGATAAEAMSHAYQEAGSPLDEFHPRLIASEPSFDGLTYPELDLGILDPSIINDGFQAFMWPEDHDVTGS
ncbi:unnamed protein product [Penicillium olsonii]|nr:unnamed protein product [Penicillium olsonii]